MKIRSITCFYHPKYPLDDRALRRAGDFLGLAKSAYEAAGYEVQTLRLATIPFPKLLGEKHLNELANLARHLEVLIPQVGVGYISLGPALPRMPHSYEPIVEAMAAAQNVFFGGLMTDKGRVDLEALRRCAQIIVKCAPIDPNGFANLRFAALANVEAGSPFFPAAYHAGGPPTFAIATEAADLAVDAFSAAKTIDEARRSLIAAIEKHGKALVQVARLLSASPNVARAEPSGHKVPSPHFRGIDFSLASFPSHAASLGTAFEQLGVPQVGLHGSLAAAAILTECLDRAHFRRTGFSGLMLPVLEDSTLAQRAAEGSLTVKDLLLYSAVCGTGLDTVPLPGDATAEQMAAVLLDLATLALRLNKPLTARLMPIPDKKAGDPTGFDFAYFANSKVMRLDAGPLGGALNGSEPFQVRSR